jgi:autotransporter adhesin
VALGDQAQATGFHSTALGGEAVASGRGAQAFGWQAKATGNVSLAVGHQSTASGIGSTALGRAANAAFDNSTAVGINATTTRANQVMVGGAGSSVTIGDIAASTSAQVGPTDVMTVDASGTLGRDTSIRPAISALQASDALQNSQIAALNALVGGEFNSRLSGIEAAQIALFDLAKINRKQAQRGIAAAVAMADAPFPSAPGKTSYAANTALYRGEFAFSLSLTHRLDSETPLALTAGLSHSGGKDTAVRAGIAGEF